MYKKLLALTLAAALLSACGDDKKTDAALACEDPAVLQSVKSNIQEIVKQEARDFARNDSRQFVDADKIIAAGSQLEILLENPETQTDGGKPVCRADLKIQVPSEILKTAETNSPLIYGKETIAQLIEKRLTGSNATFSNGLYSSAINYLPADASKKTELSFEDNALTQAAQTVSAALLPYGVKSILLIDGKPVSLEKALKMDSKAFDEPSATDPADILEKNAASSEAVGLTTEDASAPEVLSPSEPVDEAPAPADSDLQQAHEQNRSANNEINRVWNDMDKTVQQGIRDEQRSWIDRKNRDCRRAAAQAGNPDRAEYLQLQCDTRMTRERVQYLRGYTIN
ncbi:lysozyme inhibitor LprI family protein [Neisseria sp.]|uniref:lysozyme inhibitor LprI family protein n=1 Tax=Neisseria sp. TaxID=192066 RepID=UPI0035A14210